MIKQKIKVKFVDFWYGFIPSCNYFHILLSQSYEVKVSDNPDILIYSVYGKEYLKYSCIKVFYSAENIRPDFNGCDYAISFDYNNHPNHFRFPLYGIYIDQIDNVNTLLAKKTKEQALSIWRSKTKFCCMIVSNGQSQKRLDFFEELSKYKKVDSGGTVLNNIGGPVKDKMEFIKDYRFVFAFENSSNPGYTTEKIIEPLMADCIPLYWGDPLVQKEFNDACFLNLNNTKTFASFIEEIKQVDQNEEKAVEMLMADKFVGNTIPDSINKENLKLFFKKIIDEKDLKTPVSKTWRAKWHKVSVKINYYKNRVKGLLTR